jgi:hypothetical protein
MDRILDPRAIEINPDNPSTQFNASEQSTEQSGAPHAVASPCAPRRDMGRGSSRVTSDPGVMPGPILSLTRLNMPRVRPSVSGMSRPAALVLIANTPPAQLDADDFGAAVRDPVARAVPLAPHLRELRAEAAGAGADVGHRRREDTTARRVLSGARRRRAGRGGEPRRQVPRPPARRLRAARPGPPGRAARRAAPTPAPPSAKIRINAYNPATQFHTPEQSMPPAPRRVAACPCSGFVFWRE